MISVAAELAEMHPQTLRMYEARGLIEPQRSPKGTRLYSQDDVERLRRIQEMTTEWGMNLAGVERVLELEEKLDAHAPQGRGARGARRRRCRSEIAEPRGGQALGEGRDRALRGAGEGADPGGAALAPPLTFAAGRTRITSRNSTGAPVSTSWARSQGVPASLPAPSVCATAST